LSSSAGALVPSSTNATSMLWKQLVESHLSLYDITPQEHHHQSSSRHTRNTSLQTVIFTFTNLGTGLVRAHAVKQDIFEVSPSTPGLQKRFGAQLALFQSKIRPGVSKTGK
jgi:hypothetical protein